jgi:hypothetical protein
MGEHRAGLRHDHPTKNVEGIENPPSNRCVQERSRSMLAFVFLIELDHVGVSCL